MTLLEQMKERQTRARLDELLEPLIEFLAEEQIAQLTLHVSSSKSRGTIKTNVKLELLRNAVSQ